MGSSTTVAKRIDEQRTHMVSFVQPGAGFKWAGLKLPTERLLSNDGGARGSNVAQQ